jgi:hypothetical protein
MNLRKLCIGLMICGLSGAALDAHHSNASYYDTAKTVTITGTLTKVEWRSPHVFFAVDVKDANGTVTTYGLEHASPQSLYRAGFRKDDVAIGSVVEVDIMPGLRDHTTGRMRVMRFKGKNFFELGLDRPGLTD